MTKKPKELKGILGFQRESPRSKPGTNRVSVVTLVGSTGLALGVVLAASSIYIPEIEFGSGVASLPECIRAAVVDFDLQVSGTGTTIRALDVRDIEPECNGQYLRISLMGASDDVIRQLPSNLLSTSNSLRITVPAPAIDPESVFGLNLEVSDSPF